MAKPPDPSQIVLRHAMERLAVEPDMSRVKILMGRGALGPTVNLFSPDREVELTEYELGWTAQPETIKPRQFGRLELEVRYLPETHLPEGAAEAFQGSKSRIGRRNGVATLYAVSAVFVSHEFAGEGYGLAMYLRALQHVSEKGYWLVNDTTRSTSADATRTWKALFRYALKALEGPPPPQRLFDYKKQDWVQGYSSREDNLDVVVPDHRPVMAAYGLNGRGQDILAPLQG